MYLSHCINSQKATSIFISNKSFYLCASFSQSQIFHYRSSHSMSTLYMVDRLKAGRLYRCELLQLDLFKLLCFP